MKMIYQLLLGSLICAFAACTTQTEQVNEAKSVETNVSVESTENLPELVIQAERYRGIVVGSEIAEHLAYIEKSELRSPEGTFEVYRIKAYEGEDAGYFHTDRRDESKVGNIVIDVAGVKTREGIQVGDTFESLSRKIEDFTASGSEIEGRTYVHHEGLSYRLDVPNFTYEVDVNAIPNSAKILEIVIDAKKK